MIGDPQTLTGALAAWLRDGKLPPAATAVEIDGQLIDLVAVRLTLSGHWQDLSAPERRFAVAVASAAGWSAGEIAVRLRIKQRSVVRLRTAIKAREAVSA
jgi:DNA-binding NarL/FixJ family response regulator